METIHFGSQSCGYALLAILLSCSIFFAILFFRWFYTLFTPGKRLLNIKHRMLLLLLVSWPILLSIGSAFCAYYVGYAHFYSLHFEQGNEVIAEYLWPKCEVSIPKSQIEEIEVIHKGGRWSGSKILEITTTSGKRFISNAPVPSPQTLSQNINELVQKNKD